MQFVGALKPDSVIKWRKYSYCDKCCSKYLQSLKIIWSLNHLLTWLFYRVMPYSAPLILYDSYFMTCTQEYRTICKMNNLKNIWTCQTFKFSLICMSRAWLLHNLIEALSWISPKGFWQSYFSRERSFCEQGVQILYRVYYRIKWKSYITRYRGDTLDSLCDLKINQTSCRSCQLKSITSPSCPSLLN